MSVPTAEPTTSVPPDDEGGAARRRPPSWLTGGRVYLWLGLVALAIAGLSLLIPSTPSYDPWAWLVWGREILHGTLHTPGGPTWKPLPVIFTTVLALFGGAQPNLWLVVARAGALVAALMTFKLAARLTWWLRETVAAEGDRLSGLAPALLAGAIAMIGLVFHGAFITDNALGYSEGLATAALLIAVERHVDGHRHQAFALGFVAALDRPEIWLFWGPYGLWLMWKDPSSRKLVISLAVLTLVLWFVPQKWGGGSFTSGVSRAQQPRSNSAAFASCPFCTELADHAWPLVMDRIKVAALLLIGAAAVLLAQAWRRRVGGIRFRPTSRRDRALVVLAVCGLFGFIWWILIALETQAGFSGNDRYLVIGSAFIDVAGGAGFGWAALELAALLRRHLPASRDRLRPPRMLAATTVLAAAVFLVAPNWIGRGVISVSRTHRALVYQATLRKDLVALINRAGGAGRLKACGAGHVMVEGFQVPMVAWYFDSRTLNIEDQPPAIDAPAPWPNVIFQDRDTGSSALLPLPQTVIDWEHDGAHYTFVRTKEMYFFEDCAAQRNDPTQRYSS